MDDIRLEAIKLIQVNSLKFLAAEKTKAFYKKEFQAIKRTRKRKATLFTGVK